MVFDKACVDFKHLGDLDGRGVRWVPRAKENMKHRVVETLTQGKRDIISDQVVELTVPGRGTMRVRRVEARVEVDKQRRVMVFITNNLKWSPAPVCDLCRSRWDTGVFSNRIKRTLKPTGFLGHSANAVRRRIRSALLVYVLLRHLAFLSGWGHSFTRIFTVVRSVLWERSGLLALLRYHGTSPGRLRVTGTLNQAWLPGLEP